MPLLLGLLTVTYAFASDIPQLTYGAADSVSGVIGNTLYLISPNCKDFNPSGSLKLYEPPCVQYLTYDSSTDTFPGGSTLTSDAWTLMDIDKSSKSNNPVPIPFERDQYENLLPVITGSYSPANTIGATSAAVAGRGSVGAEIIILGGGNTTKCNADYTQITADHLDVFATGVDGSITMMSGFNGTAFTPFSVKAADLPKVQRVYASALGSTQEAQTAMPSADAKYKACRDTLGLDGSELLDLVYVLGGYGAPGDLLSRADLFVYRKWLRDPNGVLDKSPVPVMEWCADETVPELPIKIISMQVCAERLLCGELALCRWRFRLTKKRTHCLFWVAKAIKVAIRAPICTKYTTTRRPPTGKS
jgi:hypothetical protein